ncbi:MULTISPECIES: hypothetical protein [unclassified Ekhidna]|jgi:hypothetical protein|uniref:hypothetical protein n=1 Tax=unclassified Ekhidna TaxID=2632188 RepID=UPI0032DF66EF
MKYLAFIFLLFASELNAQITFKNLQSFDKKLLDFKMDHFSTRNLTPLQINLPSQSLINQEITPDDFKIITPQQYNLTNYPMRDLAKMDDLLLGTSFSNTLQLGNQQIQTTYIFDISGNLRGYRTNFSFRKKN